MTLSSAYIVLFIRGESPKGNCPGGKCLNTIYIYIFMYVYMKYVFMLVPLSLRCTTHGPLAGSGPRTCYIRPSEQVIKYKKLLFNDVNNGDFMNEFKLH